jgi:hypothetical protein
VVEKRGRRVRLRDPVKLKEERWGAAGVQPCTVPRHFRSTSSVTPSRLLAALLIYRRPIRPQTSITVSESTESSADRIYHLSCRTGRAGGDVGAKHLGGLGRTRTSCFVTPPLHCTPPGRHANGLAYVVSRISRRAGLVHITGGG